MQFFSTLTLTALFAIAQAAPSPADVRRSGKLVERQFSDFDYCGESNFTGETTGGSPLVSDCQALADAAWGEYDQQTGLQTTLDSSSGCAFGSDGAPGTDSGYQYQLGDTDMRDVINSAISMFSWTDENGDARVGASGIMMCQGPLGDVAIEWGIYGTP
jgi:hypothetical protein